METIAAGAVKVTTVIGTLIELARTREITDTQCHSTTSISTFRMVRSAGKSYPPFPRHRELIDNGS